MRIHRVFAVLIFMLGFAGAIAARQRSAPMVPVREVEGVLKSINDTQLVVTDEHGNAVTLNITPTTIFRSDDRAIAPSDLKPGDHVEVKAVMNNNALDALVVKVEDDDQGEMQIGELNGSIKSISGNTLVVTDAHQHDTTLTLTGTTIIMKGGHPATAADLAAGDQVEVKAMKVGTALNALLIKVENEPPHPPMIAVEGTIKSVSASEIVVTDSHQHDTTFTITGNTVIRKNDHLATAADLAVGDEVEVVGSVNGTTNTALFIHAESPEPPGEQEIEIAGLVKSTAADSITVTTLHSGDIVVKVDSHTRIRRGDMTLALADIHVGNSVLAEGTRIDDHTMLAEKILVSTGMHD